MEPAQIQAAEEHRPRNNLYQQITDAILAAVEKNAGTYQMPWHRPGNIFGRPQNVFSGRRYSGVNVVALWAACEMKGYGSQQWATYRQWEALGAQVKSGQKGTPIIFFKEIARKEDDDELHVGDRRPRFYARTSYVFNADQVLGFKAPQLKAHGVVESLVAAEELVRAIAADVRHGGVQAFYNKISDYIQIPAKESFTGTNTSTPTESYYSVLFHELGHWTGHQGRLNRDLAGRFGDQSYAMEELVAELAAAFICSDLGVASTPRQDHAFYIKNWLAVLRNDSKAIFTAARKAGDAADYVLRCGKRIAEVRRPAHVKPSVPAALLAAPIAAGVM